MLNFVVDGEIRLKRRILTQPFLWCGIENQSPAPPPFDGAQAAVVTAGLIRHISIIYERRVEIVHSKPEALDALCEVDPERAGTGTGLVVSCVEILVRV